MNGEKKGECQRVFSIVKLYIVSEEMVNSCCCHINLLSPCDVTEDHDVGTLSHGDLLTNGRAGAGALSCLPELRLRLLHNRFPTYSSSVAKFIRSFITSEVREKNGNLAYTLLNMIFMLPIKIT